MLRKILIFGVIGGLIAGGPMLVLTATSGTKALYEGGHLLGYATMLVALSTVSSPSSASATSMAAASSGSGPPWGWDWRSAWSPVSFMRRPGSWP